MPKQMRSKERVLTAIAHEEPDRAPLDYSCNQGINLRLKKHFGLAAQNQEGLLQALGVDFRTVEPRYTGPKLHPDEGKVRVNLWGVHRRWIEHQSGGYWDFCDFPLKDAGLEEIEAWPMPNPDDYDYSEVAAMCKEYEEYCIVAGNPGTGDIINSTGMVRTMEQVLIDLMTDDPGCLRYIDRKVNVQLEMLSRTLEAADGGIDLLFIGEDLGTQKGPLISVDLFRKHIRPRHQKFVDLGKAHGIPVMIHSCGSSSWAFADFVEMGIQIVDTIQPEAKDMSPRHLKETFGDVLSFHGGISTGGPVATGSVEDTIRNVRDTLDIMMPGGGYICGPAHQLQDNSPTENVVAMYAAAREYGKY